jgi:hypothetical protein
MSSPGVTAAFATSDGSELASNAADPGQDPRGAPDLTPLWTTLDSTPEGRGGGWCPKFDDGNRQRTPQHPIAHGNPGLAASLAASGARTEISGASAT